MCTLDTIFVLIYGDCNVATFQWLWQFSSFKNYINSLINQHFSRTLSRLNRSVIWSNYLSDCIFHKSLLASFAVTLQWKLLFFSLNNISYEFALIPCTSLRSLWELLCPSFQNLFIMHKYSSILIFITPNET